MILITGGAGYVGNILVRKLLTNGYKVKIFDAFFFGKDSLRDIESKVDLIKGDIRKFADYQDVLKDVDSIINLAAFSNDPTAEANPEANFEINAEGAKTVAEIAKKNGVKRFIQASSCSVYYSNNPNDALKNEETEINPTAPYSSSKHKAEKYLLAMADASFTPMVLRKGTVFGFSPRMRYDLVVNTFCKDACLKGRLTVNGGGEMWRPLVHIDDVAEAYMACLKAPEEKIKGQIFNLVHKNYRVLELAHWIKEILRNRKQIEVDAKYSDTSARDRSYRVSGEKIKKILNFETKKGITPAVNEIWDYFEKKQYNDFDNPIYYNIKWMELGNIK